MAQSANIHLIVGEDDYLLEDASRKAMASAVPGGLREGVALETIDGAADNEDSQLASIRECLASIQTPPFLEPAKITWWRGVTFLPGGGRNGKITDKVKAALERLAETLARNPLPQNQAFVISATKLLKTSVFAKAFKAFSQVVELGGGAQKGAYRKEAAIPLLEELAEREGLVFEQDAAAAFIAKVGCDARRMVSELEKLRTYLGEGNGRVGVDDVAAISSIGGDEPELWEITDAFGRRDVNRLMSVLSRFEGERGFGMVLGAVMDKYLREMIVCREALERGWISSSGTWSPRLPPEVADDLDVSGFGPKTARAPWLVRKTVSAARNFSLRDLREARWHLLQVRESFSSDADAATNVMLRILARPRPKPLR